MLSTTFFLITVVIIGSLVSFVIQISNIDEHEYSGEIFKPPPVIDPAHDSIIIDDKLDHLMWFMQISDIHLSVIFDPKRVSDFQRFCDIVVPSVRPSVVLATGDLTDSRTSEPFGSTQFEQEWKWYGEALNSSGVTQKTVWLDMRGNHDAFNVYSWNSSNNYYRKYSHRGNQSAGHYVYTLTKGSDHYNFLGIDACLEPSPKRPFNFIGYLKESDLNSIKDLIRKSPEANMTIWFGHYPTSSIIEQTPGLRHLITGPYLCGHFHTLVGMVPRMYATQKTGYLEIEVADWKDERMFRVASVDHGLFNFVDVKLDHWPIILITNPKAALFYMSRFEPLHRIVNSTHIRALVFSPHPVEAVHVKIDNEPWQDMSLASSAQPLWVHRWNPRKYPSGLHWISIKATDEQGNENEVRQQFSLDNSRPDFTFGGRFLLRVGTRSFLQAVFMFIVFISIFPLFLMRLLHFYNKGEIIRIRARSSLMHKMYFKLYLLSSADKFFLPLVIIPLYALVGPWFIGDLLDGHWGVCFAWGMYIEGHWVPVGLPYLFGSINMILYHMPVVACLAHIIHKKYLELHSGTIEKSWTRRIFRTRHFIMAFIIFCDILFNSSFWMAYGFKSVVFGFERFWSIVIYLILWGMTFNLTPNCFTDHIKDKN